MPLNTLNRHPSHKSRLSLQYTRTAVSDVQEVSYRNPVILSSHLYSIYSILYDPLVSQSNNSLPSLPSSLFCRPLISSSFTFPSVPNQIRFGRGLPCLFFRSLPFFYCGIKASLLNKLTFPSTFFLFILFSLTLYNHGFIPMGTQIGSRTNS